MKVSGFLKRRGEGAADSRRQPLFGGGSRADLFRWIVFQSLFHGLMPSWRAVAKSPGSRSRARTQPAARRFLSRNSVPAQTRIRRMGISDAGDAAAPADATDTWTPPILPTQCAQRIWCIGSKDTCTSQASQGNRHKSAPRARGRYELGRMPD